MPFWLYNIVMPLFGWLHIVGATLLLGGTLFYEFVMVEAVEDLKPWHQLGVLGHVRWTFRLIVIWSTLFIVASGVVMTWRLWPAYREDYAPTRIWWLTHVALGIVGMAIALRLTLYGRVPPHTRPWMRVNLILLLIVVFLAGVARHVRLIMDESRTVNAPAHHARLIHRMPEDVGANP